MRGEHVQPEDLSWRCHRCHRPLEVGPVTVAYMGAQFETRLARCPQCGLVLVSEETALGQMAEAELILEDK
jgi:DNA-directed RNA polymerase subunit RPC12/RpoP